jgi:Cd2+/Zn2+-exporting ATPase
MGTAGTDAALEVADVALMSDDLGRLAPLVRLAKSTMRVIAQNVTFSLVTKAAFLVLAIAGAATLWMAVAADMGASLLVIFNGLRLARVSLAPGEPRGAA